MSALGHKRTFAPQKGMSALLPKADFAIRISLCGNSCLWPAWNQSALYPMPITILPCSGAYLSSLIATGAPVAKSKTSPMARLNSISGQTLRPSGTLSIHAGVLFGGPSNSRERIDKVTRQENRVHILRKNDNLLRRVLCLE
jgi:hypothetical protein